jgi:hypothetical protein
MSRRALPVLLRLLSGLLFLIPALSPRPAAALPTWHFVLTAADPEGQRVSLAPPSLVLPDLEDAPINIEARGEIVQEREDGPVVASGGVTLTQGNVRLTAEQLTADPNTGDVTAEGDVVFTDPERTVRGRTLSYNAYSRRVRATDVETVVQGVIIRAQSIDAVSTRYTVGRATVTTCELPRPHYRLTARSVVLIPNNRIVARRVGIWLFGTRLFVVPRLTARIGAGQGEGGRTPFPRLGRNSRDGFFVANVVPLIARPRLTLDLDARLSLRRGLTGGLEAAAPGGKQLQYIGALKIREESSTQRTRFLEVDRLPEVGVLWVSPAPAWRSDQEPPQRRPDTQVQPKDAVPAPQVTDDEERPAFRSLRQVGSDVAHQPDLLRPPTRGRWYLRAQSTVGYFHQHEGETVRARSGVRLDARATASRSGLRLFGVSLPVIHLFARRSFYDAGDNYGVLGAAMGQDWRLGRHWSGRLRAFLHSTQGRTPFEFDLVEVRNELQPGVSYTVGGTTLSWAGRLDMDRRELFDQEIAVARVFHCLEPRISYRTRRRQIGLDVRIVGLEID